MMRLQSYLRMVVVMVNLLLLIAGVAYADPSAGQGGGG